MSVDPTLKSVTLQFHGQAGEYFRIWIVNIFLTIITLGIYSAWAKVRNKQYFYGNTAFDDSPFEYTANPIAILKGRLIVVAILSVYFITTHFFPLTQGIFGLLFFLVLPWLVMRSLMFNARYSCYRNINFAFADSLSGEVRTFIGIGLLIPFTLGLIYPYYMYAIQQYRVGNHSFGQFSFDLKPIVKSFYKYYFVGFIILFIGTGVVFVGSTAAPVHSDNTESEVSLLMVLAPIVYLFAFAYVRARVFNKVWTNTSLDKKDKFSMQAVLLLSFKSSMQVGQLFLLYLTNTIAIIASVGLLIPWAKVRMTRYRIQCLEASCISDLKAIIADQQEQVGTIGSEMGDVLDIDIGM